MQVLVVEQHEAPSDGVVGDTLRELGVQTCTFWGARGDALPDGHRDHDGLIVLGGAMSALDDDSRPYFPSLTRLIRDFEEAGKPVLGICLGAQLIARAFDSDVRLGGNLELGFHTVSPTPAAADDPVLGCLDKPLPLFQWHTDHYTLPPQAVHLARGEAYGYQAFRIGRTVYGMQFHPEATESVVRSWIEAIPELDEHAPGYREWLPAQFEAHGEAAEAFCRRATRRWVALLG